MIYKIKKETKPTLQTFGKYKAVAVHNQTIDSKRIVKETAQRTSFSEGNIIGVLMSVAEVVNSHLREGDRVRRGDPIATISESGRESGIGLHYEIRVDGVPVNPEDYFITK